MKNARKYISFLTALVFVLSLQMPVAANTTDEITAAFIPIQPLWQNVDQATARLTRSGTTAHCSATITGLSGTTRIVATMQLQRVSGNSVTTVSTWTQSVNGNRLVMSESATVTSNGTYRLRVDATVTRNGVSESISISG
jgi:hypothetical protein